MSSVNEWPMVKLGDLGRFISGGTPNRKRPEFYEGSIPWISSADLSDTGEISTRRAITEEAIASSATKLVPAHTILIATRIGVGKVAITSEEMCFSQDIVALVDIDEAIVSSSFLKHMILITRPYLQGIARGVTIKGISTSDLQRLELPLPPLDEQQRIAEILDNAASLIEASTAKINGLNELEESSFIFLFGDESVSTTTEEVAAKYKNSIRTGPFGSQLKHGEFVNEGISVLGLDNVVSNQFRWASPRFITPEKYEQLKRYTVHPGDVLISIMGTTGRCAIVPDNLPTTINTKHICAITTDRARMLSEFLRAAFLWHPEVRQSLRQQTKGAIMAGLNMGIIRNLPLPAPEMSQQRAWSEFTSEINKLREKLLEQELLSRELHQTLATRAFAGEL